MSGEPKKIASLPTNFHISLEDRVRAAAGIPAYIRRLRRIEDLTEALVEALEEFLEDRLLYEDLSLDEAWHVVEQQAEQLDLSLLNDLIRRHNEYYPIEANLPVDPATDRFLSMGKPWTPMDPVTPKDVLEKLRERRLKGKKLPGSSLTLRSKREDAVQRRSEGTTRERTATERGNGT